MHYFYLAWPPNTLQWLFLFLSSEHAIHSCRHFIPFNKDHSSIAGIGKWCRAACEHRGPWTWVRVPQKHADFSNHRGLPTGCPGTPSSLTLVTSFKWSSGGSTSQTSYASRQPLQNKNSSAPLRAGIARGEPQNSLQALGAAAPPIKKRNLVKRLHCNFR